MKRYSHIIFCIFCLIFFNSAFSQERVLEKSDLSTVIPKKGDYLKLPHLTNYSGIWLNDKNDIRMSLKVIKKRVGDIHIDYLEGSIEINGKIEHIEGYTDYDDPSLLKLNFTDLSERFKKLEMTHIGPTEYDLILKKVDQNSLRVVFNDKRIKDYNIDSADKYDIVLPSQFILISSNKED